MRLASLAISGFLLASCHMAKNVSAKIVPTTGEFSYQEEVVYQKRFAEMTKAFQSGQDTTNYDTEIQFGQSLMPAPLVRGAEGFSKQLIEELTQYAKDQNSASFMIVKDGRVISESYFDETTGESLLTAKSLAKPLGVIALGRAIKLGYIRSLDQPASDFIIEWKGTDKESILLRHLLDMRSGLLPQGYSPDVKDVLNRAYLHPRHDEVLIHEYPLVDVPGSRYEYSNANSELVSIVIERATSITYPKWLTDQVLSPLGASGGKIWMNRVGGMAHSGCCVRLTSETYMKLGLLILQKGAWKGEQLLTQTFVEQMMTNTPQNKYAGTGLYLGKHYTKYRGARNPDYRDGTLHSEPYIDTDIALFDGNGNQVIYIMPSRNVVIMRLGARPSNKKVPWDNAYIPNSVSRFLDAQ